MDFLKRYGTKQFREALLDAMPALRGSRTLRALAVHLLFADPIGDGYILVTKDTVRTCFGREWRKSSGQPHPLDEFAERVAPLEFAKEVDIVTGEARDWNFVTKQARSP